MTERLTPHSAQESSPLHEQGALTSEQLEKLFSQYKEVSYFLSPVFEHILEIPIAQTVVLSARTHGQSTTFEDLEFVTYFYNFSKENLEKLLAQESRKPLGIHEAVSADEGSGQETEGILIHRERGISKTTIAEKLKELIKNDKKVTHIVCAEEIYGGETHYSVWRTHKSARIYEFDEGRFRWRYRFVEPSFS